MLIRELRDTSRVPVIVCWSRTIFRLLFFFICGKLAELIINMNVKVNSDNSPIDFEHKLDRNYLSVRKCNNFFPGRGHTAPPHVMNVPIILLVVRQTIKQTDITSSMKESNKREKSE